MLLRNILSFHDPQCMYVHTHIVHVPQSYHSEFDSCFSHFGIIVVSLSKKLLSVYPTGEAALPPVTCLGQLFMSHTTCTHTHVRTRTSPCTYMRVHVDTQYLQGYTPTFTSSCAHTHTHTHTRRHM